MVAFPNDAKYCLHIAIVLVIAATAIAACLLFSNTNAGGAWLRAVFGSMSALMLELYFWGALGATVASYKFFAEDKERNELESVKEVPRPEELRYPNLLDVALYGLRIVFSGVLGVVGALVMIAALGYFDAPTASPTTKLRLFLVIACFLIGMYQNEFLAALARLNQSILEKLRVGSPGGHGGATA